MNAQKFDYQNGMAIRIVPELTHETAWFVAKDVCDILGLTDTHKAVQKLDDDEKLIYKLYISGQERETWTINESGLYSLILTSIKPEAKTFKRWITHEVLPAIRRAGKYTTDQANEREQKIQALVLEIDTLEDEIKELKNEVSAHNEVLKFKQTELRGVLKADIRQLSLDFS